MRCPKCGAEANEGVTTSDGCVEIRVVFVEGGEWVDGDDSYQMEATHKAFTCSNPTCETFFTVQ
jgi:hypothetical protein